jgi:hypothetical protein
MPAVTLEASASLHRHAKDSRELARLLPGLCAEILLYGIFVATTFLTFRALLFARKTPYECWKSHWPFVLAAFAMFIIGTYDVAVTIWTSSLLSQAVADSRQFVHVSTDRLSIQARYLPIKLTDL